MFQYLLIILFIKLCILIAIFMWSLLNKRVEGLLTRGAMKPNDRPLWFDVYKKFPPTVEPKFSRPKVDLGPIRQIFYEEDIIRAKINSKRYGLGSINMIALTGETPIKKIIEQYKKLEAEGVPEDEIVEKAVSAVETERKMDNSNSKVTESFHPKSVTGQVLSEANIKDIFKEEK